MGKAESGLILGGVIPKLLRLQVRERHRLDEMTTRLPGTSLQKDASVSFLPAWYS